ncbi:SusC/RagA family TonB-linked outer membrane protein [Flavobacterium sp. WC2509]|uniref:SusC/RagA family TonB-linked outer membrane protein n=1 Tax=Flavobacterium sp. WC2509 TaxID=3461406 RepID=UPI0040446D38
MKKENKFNYQHSISITKYFLVGLFMIFASHFAQAQSKTVSGFVRDENKSPITGVTVTVKGTKTVTSTDFDGSYKIAASASDQLVFSFVGFNTKTISVDTRTKIDVSLETSTSNLEEIVVIGYGTVKRKDLTGAVSSVSMSDLSRTPIRSFDDALAGRVAGVQVTSADGMPGAGTNIVIRGNNSVTQANSPLYVIDGFLVEGANNNVINPEDIASIDVLKDASATAIYGARGANGVIVIQTKRGKQGKPVFSFSSSIGVQEIAKKMDMMSTYDFVKYQLEYNTIGSPSNPIPPGTTVSPIPPYKLYITDPGKTLEDYRNVPATDWQDLSTRTALFKKNDLSISGGTKKIKYLVSGSTTDQDGILLNSNYTRYQGRANVDYQITNKLKIGGNSNYSYLKQTGIDPSAAIYNGSANVMVSVWGMRPYSPSVANPEDEFIDPNLNSGFDLRVNPVLNLKNTYNVTTTNNFSVNGYLEYFITKELKLRSTLGYVSNKVEKDEFYNSYTALGRPGSASGVNGKMMNNNYTNWLNENTLTWDKRIKKHHFVVLGGFTNQKQESESYGKAANKIPAASEGLMFDSLDLGTALRIDPGNSVWTMASFLGRVNYDYASKYFLTASYRADGSSKFPSSNHWGYFPSGAVSWKFSEEKFIKNEYLSEGKLRASYGQTGNNRVGDFDYLTTYYDPGNPFYGTYVFDNNHVTGATAQKLGNSDLKWETTEQIDAGLDLGFFKQRITFSADVYKKTTKDLLLKTNLPLSTGFTSAFKNIGSVENKGLELTLTTKNIVSKDFSWTTSANISFNRNKLLALAEGQNNLESVVNWDTDYKGVSAYNAVVGQPLGQMYGFEYAGTYKYQDFTGSGTTADPYKLKAGLANNGNVNVQPGDVKYVDQNGDNTITAKDYTTIGNGNPLNTGGFSNNFTYKNFDLNIFFQWSYGNDIINANRIVFDGNQLGAGAGREGLNQFSSYQDRWTPENPDSDVVRTKGFVGTPVAYSSRLVEDGSYLRLKNVAVGYNFDKKFIEKMHLKSMRFSLSASNIYTWTKYSGSDPEVNTYNSALTPGFDYSSYPRARTVFFTANISF